MSSSIRSVFSEGQIKIGLFASINNNKKSDISGTDWLIIKRRLIQSKREVESSGWNTTWETFIDEQLYRCTIRSGLEFDSHEGLYRDLSSLTPL